MTLTHKTPRVRYTGDGSTKTFAVPFPYGEQSDLSVVLYHADKSQTQATIASITGAGTANGGTVTLTSAPDAGVIVTVLRQVDYVQKLRLDVGGELPSKSLERALDYTVMQTQQLAEFQGRTLRLMPHTALKAPIWVEEPKDGVAPVYKRQNDGSYRLVPSSGSLETQLTESKGYVASVKKISTQVQTDKTTIAGYKTATENASTQAQKLLQDTQTKLATFDKSNFAQSNLSNVSTTDFKTKATSAGLGAQKLATQIFTQTSGKFFVRNADDTLPSGIDTNKVWSLAEQKTAHGGTMPSGKIHIELPAGVNAFYVSGAGGGGGGAGASGGSSSTKGGNGENTTIPSLSISASGGSGGYAGGRFYSGRTPLPNLGGGAQGGVGARSQYGGHAGAGADGYDGDLIVVSKSLSKGSVHDFNVGNGGYGGSNRDSRTQLPAHGSKGYIRVEYAL